MIFGATITVLLGTLAACILLLGRFTLMVIGFFLFFSALITFQQTIHSATRDKFLWFFAVRTITTIRVNRTTYLFAQRESIFFKTNHDFSISTLQVVSLFSMQASKIFYSILNII